MPSLTLHRKHLITQFQSLPLLVQVNVDGLHGFLAGLDNRIKSVVTLVIPVFEIKKVFERSFNDICAWPYAMSKYENQGVFKELLASSFDKLSQIVDPKYYARLATIPKLQVLGMGDEFFSLDVNQVGFDAILGEKYVRYVPNFGHDLARSDAMNVILTYQVARMNNIALPQYQFYHNFTADGLTIDVKVTNGIKPSQVFLWSATNSVRNFRTDVVPVWNSTLIQEVEPFHWRVLVKNPPQGYSAATVELVFNDFISESCTRCCYGSIEDYHKFLHYSKYFTVPTVTTKGYIICELWTVLGESYHVDFPCLWCLYACLLSVLTNFSKLTNK